MINSSIIKVVSKSANQYLKQTRSLCPICFTEVDSALYREDRGLYISKACAVHGTFSNVLDPDADIYLQCASTGRNNNSRYGTVIPISYRCDLDCTWCYLPERGKEPTIEQIIEIIKRCRSRYVVFSGGEPTMRSELPELIEYVRRNYPYKKTVLLTNGLNIANYDYASLLKKAGLQYCIISFNGFLASTHKTFNGRDLSLEKTSALHNLKTLKIWTILSMTIAKGINEDEFGGVLFYGLSNLDFIRQIRLRNVSDIGKFHRGSNIYMSDMLKMVSRATGFSLPEMFTENNVSNRRTKTGNYFVMNIFNMMRRNGQTAYPLLLQRAYQTYNSTLLADERQLPPDERLTFSIEIFFWPTAENVDLDECRQFCIDHVTTDGAILPFWEALFRNELLRMRARENTIISNE